jgi:hypothetical protein
MKRSDLTDLSTISSYRYENFFNIYADPKNNNELFYNVLVGINIVPANNEVVDEDYYIKPRDTWINISYNYYKTMDLWWLICVYNQIMNPLEMPEIGTRIKLLRTNYVGTVLNELKRQIEK